MTNGNGVGGVDFGQGVLVAVGITFIENSFVLIDLSILTIPIFISHILFELKKKINCYTCKS